MKKTGILNAELMRLIAAMGHTDRLVIADSGLPIPPAVLRIDLALVAGIPSFVQTLQAVLAELQVEAAAVADEMRQRSPSLYQATRQILVNTRLFACTTSRELSRVAASIFSATSPVSISGASGLKSGPPLSPPGHGVLSSPAKYA